MNEAQAVEALNAIDTTRDRNGFQDAGGHHSQADEILLRFLEANHPAIQEAYSRIEDGCSWWAFA